MSYSPGTIVYAKLKGYPWWPARVENDSSIPSDVRSKKPKTPKPIVGVRFFGSKDYAWLGSNDLKPFDNKVAEIALQKMKNKKRDNKLLERSIREALDPSSFDEEGADDVSDSDLELEDESKKSSESYENDDDDEEEFRKSKIRSKGNKKNKKSPLKSSDHRRSKSLKKKSSRSYSSEDDDDSILIGKSGKKRRASEGAIMDKASKRKQRRIDYANYTDDEDEKMDLDEKNEFERKKERRHKDRSEGSKSPKSDNDSHEDENKYNKGDNESKSSRMESESHHRSSKSRQSRTPGDRLLHLRHKLQRMTLKEVNEPLDTEKIDEVFTEVENFPISIPLLKDSKIGKLMRKIAEKKFEKDPIRIIERSNELIRKWKCLLEAPNTHEGSDEETSPKTVTQAEGESPHQEVINNDDLSQPLPDEQEIEIKKEEGDIDSNNVKVEKERLPSAMDLDEVEVKPEPGEEKQMVEGKDNIVTNGSSLAISNQEVSSHEKEDFDIKSEL